MNIYWIFLTFGFLFLRAKGTAIKNKLLLVSFDGFRWDYFKKPLNLTSFKSFALDGTTAEYVVNNFPTKTFPSHITISTGLFSESHGIVGNKMYDPSMNATFNLSCKECQTDPKWFGGEPIWITATKNKIRSGTMFWPGSEVAYGGIKPEKWMAYNGSFSYSSRIDNVVSWLKDGTDMATLYFEEPDKTGHKYGPDSPEVDQALIRMDKLLNTLLLSLKEANLLETTNIILTSDHGMISTPPEKNINLRNKLDRSLVERVVVDGVALMINANLGKADELYRHLSKLKDEFGHMTVYRKQDIPDNMHYKDNIRITDFVVIADEGYLLLSEREKIWGNATHGYDPKYPSMWPFFMARGPSIKSNYTAKHFKQEDIYVLMTNLLGIKPSPNNGSFERIQPLLVNDGNSRHSIKLKYITIVSHILLFIINRV